MADDPKPGTPGGIRSNYEGWDVVYVDGKYIDPQLKQETKPAPKEPATRFGKRGLPAEEVSKKPENNAPVKSGSEIVREVRARLKQGKKHP